MPSSYGVERSKKIPYPSRWRHIPSKCQQTLTHQHCIVTEDQIFTATCIKQYVTVCHLLMCGSCGYWYGQLIIWPLWQRQMWWTVLPQSWGDRVIIIIYIYIFNCKWAVARWQWSELNLTCAMKCGITWQPQTVPVIAVWPYIGQVKLQCHLFCKIHPRGRWMFSFTAWMFYPHERNLYLSLNWRPCRLHSWSVHLWRR